MSSEGAHWPTQAGDSGSVRSSGETAGVPELPEDRLDLRISPSVRGPCSRASRSRVNPTGGGRQAKLDRHSPADDIVELRFCRAGEPVRTLDEHSDQADLPTGQDRHLWPVARRWRSPISRYASELREERCSGYPLPCNGQMEAFSLSADKGQGSLILR